MANATSLVTNETKKTEETPFFLSRVMDYRIKYLSLSKYF